MYDLFRLPEWLAYLSTLGVDHVVLMNHVHQPTEDPARDPNEWASMRQNNAETMAQRLHDMTQVLALASPWIRRGFASYIPIDQPNCSPAYRSDPGVRSFSAQWTADEICLRRLEGQAEWITFADVDEYFALSPSMPGLDALVKHHHVLERTTGNNQSMTAELRFQHWSAYCDYANHRQCGNHMVESPVQFMNTACGARRSPPDTSDLYGNMYSLISTDGTARRWVTSKSLVRPDYVDLHFVHYYSHRSNAAVRMVAPPHGMLLHMRRNSIASPSRRGQFKTLSDILSVEAGQRWDSEVMARTLRAMQSAYNVSQDAPGAREACTLWNQITL